MLALLLSDSVRYFDGRLIYSTLAFELVREVDVRRLLDLLELVGLLADKALVGLDFGGLSRGAVV